MNKLVTCGIDSKVRIWNFEQEKVIDKVNLHTYAVMHLVFDANVGELYMATTDKILYRYHIATKVSSVIQTF
jgi:hypothetical protein